MHWPPTLDASYHKLRVFNKITDSLIFQCFVTDLYPLGDIYGRRSMLIWSRRQSLKVQTLLLQWSELYSPVIEQQNHLIYARCGAVKSLQDSAHTFDRCKFVKFGDQ